MLTNAPESRVRSIVAIPMVRGENDINSSTVLAMKSKRDAHILLRFGQRVRELRKEGGQPEVYTVLCL